MTRSAAYWPILALLHWLLPVMHSDVPLKPETYIPEISSPLEDSWRWSEIEQFSDYKLTCVSEDDAGQLWFGLEDGIIRYDGYAITPIHTCSRVKDIEVFAPNEIYAVTTDALWYFDGDTWQKLADNNSSQWTANLIAKDNEGNVWVALTSGLIRVNGSTVHPVPQISFTVNSLIVDSRDRLWLAKASSGKLVICPLANGEIPDRSQWLARIEPYNDPLGYSHIEKERDGHVLVVTNHNTSTVRRFDKDLKPTIVKRSIQTDKTIPIKAVAEIRENELLLTDNYNVYLLRNHYARVTSWNDIHIENAIYRPRIIHRTKDDFLIIGGVNSSLYRMDLKNRQWTRYKNLIFQCEDNSENRWYISHDNQVVRENTQSGAWNIVRPDSGTISSPLVIISSQDGTIWLAGSHEGVAAVAYFDGKSWIRNLHPELGDFISHLSAFEDSSGQILFGCGTEGKVVAGGIVKYKKSVSGYNFEHNKTPDMPYRVVSIAEDKNNNVWFGGVDLIKNSNNKPTRIRLESKQPIFWHDQISIDSSGNPWVAIWGEGIYQKQDESWIFHSKKNGLVANTVNNILATKNTGVWAATDSGFSRNQNGDWIKNALPAELSFNRESGTLNTSKDGAIWINRASRKWFFQNSTQPTPIGIEDPTFESIRYRRDKNPPRSYIERFDKQILEDGTLSISWSGKDKWSTTQKEHLDFSYRINQGEWSAFAAEQDIFLSNYPAGNYIFEVRARDHDGNIDTNPAFAEIRIVPFLWKRPWFILSVLAVILTILSLIGVNFKTRMRHLIEIREFKHWFTSEITQGFKKPLSAIIGPIDRALEETPHGQRQKELRIAKINADKMLHEVNQLIDFQKVELGEMTVELSNTDIISFIEDTVATQKEIADENNISLNVVSNSDIHICAVDTAKTKKVIVTLVLNAISNTKTGRSIDLSTEIENDKLILKIETNGKAISKEQLQRINNPYIKIKEENSTEQASSSISLSLAHKVTRFLNGSLQITELSTADKTGNCFILKMPLPAPTTEEQNDRNNTVNPHEKDSILIANENSNDRTFLKFELANEYEIFEINTESEALEMAVKASPSIIITDVNASNLNGLALCKTIKSNRLTSHIPVIMLTTESSPKNELEGLEHGTDEYITKPFNARVLKAKIRNIVKTRRSLNEKFLRQKVLEPKNASFNTLDEKFLEQAINAVETNITEPEFSVDKLSEAMNMSRMTLYRKLKALAGQSPTTFINTIRIKRAVQLLEKGSVSIQEVSDHAGFNDSNYFSRCFKKEYKCSPREYMARHANEEST